MISLVPSGEDGSSRRSGSALRRVRTDEGARLSVVDGKPLQVRVVLLARLLTLQSFHVVVHPRVATIRRRARQRVRTHEVHQPLLGAVPRKVRLPVACLLVAVWSVAQLPQQASGLGI